MPPKTDEFYHSNARPTSAHKNSIVARQRWNRDCERQWNRDRESSADSRLRFRCDRIAASTIAIPSRSDPSVCDHYFTVIKLRRPQSLLCCYLITASEIAVRSDRNVGCDQIATSGAIRSQRRARSRRQSDRGVEHDRITASTAIPSRSDGGIYIYIYLFN